MRKKVINFLLKNNGRLPEGMSWANVADKFNIPLPNPKKNKNKSIKDRKRLRGRKANDICIESDFFFWNG